MAHNFNPKLKTHKCLGCPMEIELSRKRCLSCAAEHQRGTDIARYARRRKRRKLEKAKGNDDNNR